MKATFTSHQSVRQFLRLSLLLCLVYGLDVAPSLAQQTGSTGFEARLIGANEVPSVQTTGSGQVTAVLDGDQLHVTGSFTLESEFTAAHLHQGGIGENGAPIFTLTPTLDENQLGGTFNQTFMLSQAQVEDLKDAGLYVNVHSQARADGAIRGQLLPFATRYFSSRLDADALSPALGRILGILQGSELRLFGHFANLEGNFSSASLHVGNDPASPPLVTFTANPDDNQHGGVFLAQRNIISLTDAMVADLLDGHLWMRVYASGQPTSELLGQVLPAFEGLAVYEAVLTGINEVPSVNTPALGYVTVLLGAPGSGDRVIQVFGSFSSLQGPVSAAHLHQGAIGMTGGPVVTLPPVPAMEQRSGVLRLLDHTLTQELTHALQTGQLYVNVHSTAFPDGEIRGQLLPARSRALSVPLTGDAVVPPVATDATGHAALLVRGNELRLMGAFSNLSGDFSNAFLHVGAESENTPSIRTLQPMVASDQRNGVFLASVDNTVYLTDEEFAAWQAGHLYMTVNSTAHAGGELRAQFEGDPLTSTVDLGHGVPHAFTVYGNYPNPFNPSTQIVFDLAVTASVHVEVFDLLGRRVLVLPAQALTAGPARTFLVDAGTLASGSYLYRIIAQHQGGVQTATGRMLLVK